MGINQSRLAYPGLDFRFHIYIFADPGQRTSEWETYIGRGALYSDMEESASGLRTQSEWVERFG